MSGSSGLDLNGVAVEVVRRALDSGYILQVEPTGSPDHLDAGCEGKRVKYGTKLSGCSCHFPGQQGCGQRKCGGWRESRIGLFKMPADTQVEM